jgi:hypothetical protein
MALFLILLFLFQYSYGMEKRKLTYDADAIADEMAKRRRADDLSFINKVFTQIENKDFGAFDASDIVENKENIPLIKAIIESSSVDDKWLERIKVNCLERLLRGISKSYYSECKALLIKSIKFSEADATGKFCVRQDMLRLISCYPYDIFSIGLRNGISPNALYIKNKTLLMTKIEMRNQYSNYDNQNINVLQYYGAHLNKSVDGKTVYDYATDTDKKWLVKVNARRTHRMIQFLKRCIHGKESSWNMIPQDIWFKIMEFHYDPLTPDDKKLIVEYPKDDYLIKVTPEELRKKRAMT